MSKYIKLSIATQLATGTTTSNGIPSDQTIDTGATFLADGIRPGDIVYTTATPSYNTVKSLQFSDPVNPAVDTTILDMVAGEGINTALAYIVYSQDATSTYQLLPLDAIASVNQTGPLETVVQLTSVANATVTIDHTSYGTAANPLFANLILDAMVEASSPNDRPKVVTEVDAGVSAFIDAIAIT